MKKSWFKEWGWLYTPVTNEGILITALLILFMVHIFIVVDRSSDSGINTLYGIFPYWVPAVLAWLWIGSKTSAN